VGTFNTDQCEVEMRHFIMAYVAAGCHLTPEEGEGDGPPPAVEGDGPPPCIAQQFMERIVNGEVLTPAECLGINEFDMSACDAGLVAFLTMYVAEGCSMKVPFTRM